jgi:hypothetical protein
MFFKFQKTEPRRFNYQPRFYDPDTEAWKDSRKVPKSRRDEVAPAELSKFRVGQYFSSVRGAERGRKRTHWGKSNVRTTLIMLGLFVAFYFAIQQYMPAIAKFMFPNEMEGRTYKKMDDFE